MKLFALLTMVILCGPLLSDTALVTVSGGCGKTATSQNCCLGPMTVPSEYAEKCTTASQLAIDVLYSPEFEQALALYIDSIPSAHKQDEDWQGVNAHEVSQEIRARVCGLHVRMRTGTKAWFACHFFGELASEGGVDVLPVKRSVLVDGVEHSVLVNDTVHFVLLNQYALGNRKATEIANSIAHEAAHRVGLTHLGKNRDCEPPYVIQRIVERLAK